MLRSNFKSAKELRKSTANKVRQERTSRLMTMFGGRLPNPLERYKLFERKFEEIEGYTWTPFFADLAARNEIREPMARERARLKKAADLFISGAIIPEKEEVIATIEEIEVKKEKKKLRAKERNKANRSEKAHKKNRVSTPTKEE